MRDAAGPGPTCRSPRCYGWAAGRSVSSQWSVTRRAISSRAAAPGRGVVAGVLTGGTTRDEFEAAKAPHVLDTIADLLPLAGVTAPRH